VPSFFSGPTNRHPPATPQIEAFVHQAENYPGENSRSAFDGAPDALPPDEADDA
jgi:hypothetical protein